MKSAILIICSKKFTRHILEYYLYAQHNRQGYLPMHAMIGNKKRTHLILM